MDSCAQAAGPQRGHSADQAPCDAAEKHYGAAVALYTKAIDLDGSNAVYYSNRAFAHIKLEEYGSAVADATQAIEVDASYAKVGPPGAASTPAWLPCQPLALRRTLAEIGRCCCGLAHAVVCLQGYYRRGDANFMLGKFKEALKDFKTVSSWRPACRSRSSTAQPPQRQPAARRQQEVHATGLRRRCARCSSMTQWQRH